MGELVALVFSEDADPQCVPGGDGRPAHVVRAELPIIEGILRERGCEVLSLPMGEPVLDRMRKLALRRPSAVINLCEDLLGDSAHEMHFTALLELLGLPYTGSPPLALGLCRDKGRTKTLLRQYGIPTPPFIVVTGKGFRLDDLSFPLIAKPSAEDGSLGIDDRSLCGEEHSLRRKVAGLLDTYGEVIIEEYIGGRELNVSVLGGTPERVLPVSEIDFSGLPEGVPAICGYEAKWDEEDVRYRGTIPLCPARIEEEEMEKLRIYSLSIYRILGMRDYGRIDWRLSPGRGLQFLEANPNPDISPSSGFVRSLRAAGLDYGEFVDLLLSAAKSRGRDRRGSAAP